MELGIWIQNTQCGLVRILHWGSIFLTQKKSSSVGIFNSVNLALYHYSGNNPIKYTDPDGRDHGIPSDVQRILDKPAGALPYEPEKWKL